MNKLIAAVSITIILCGTLIWGFSIGSNTVLTVKNKGYVSVKGFAKQSIKSDLGIFKVMISAKNMDLKLAYEKLAADRKEVEAFLKTYKLSSGAISVSPVSIQEKFKVNSKGYSTPVLDHVVVSQYFEVRDGDVLKVAKMSSEIGELMGKGIAAQAYAPQFVYTDLEDLKVEMIGRATSNATERSKTLSRNGKFRLGKIADVRVGIFQITPLHSTEISGYGINDTTSIHKEIKSVVDVKYFVR